MHRTTRGIQGPAIFLARFIGDEPPSTVSTASPADAGRLQLPPDGPPPKVDGPVGIEEVLGPDTLRLLKDRNLYLSASFCQLPGPAMPREAPLPN